MPRTNPGDVRVDVIFYGKARKERETIELLSALIEVRGRDESLAAIAKEVLLWAAAKAAKSPFLNPDIEVEPAQVKTAPTALPVVLPTNSEPFKPMEWTP